MATTRRSLIGAGFLGIAAALGGCISSPTPSASPVPSPGTLPPSPAGTPSATPSAALSDPLPAGVVNVLVFGTDSRDPASLTGNADAIVVAQLSADRTRLSLVSIARDSYVPFAGGGKGKINASFSGGGTQRLRGTVSALLGGLPIHMVAQANFDNFIAITRWLGGIRVQNKNATRVRVNSTGRVVEFPQGELLLESTDGLIYARERKTMPLQRIDLNAVTSLLVPIARFDTISGASVCVVNEARTAQLAEGLKAGDLSGYVARYGDGYAPGA